MREMPLKIAVTSGKGGAGKTTVATCLALSAKEPVQFLDCDVEEPDGKIFLLPRIFRLEYACVPVPVINRNLCTYCGKCAEFCGFNALAVVKKKILLFEKLCRGCSGCWLVCPEGAISEGSRSIGVIKEGEVEQVDFMEGEIEPGEEMGHSIISKMKENIKKDKIVIIDSPPGLSPSVVETIDRTDYCVIVAECSPFGFHDMRLTAELAEKLGIPHGVVINKNRDDNNTEDIEEYCERKKINLLLKIPFDLEIAKFYSRGIPFITEIPGWNNKFREMLHKIKKSVV